MIDLKTPQEIYEHIKNYPDIIDDLKIWQLKMALDYSNSIDETIAARLFNFPDKVMQNEEMLKAVQKRFHNDSGKQLNDKINKLIHHKLSLMKKDNTVEKNHKKKHYTPEEQKTYFEYAEWQADRLIERFNTKLSAGTDAISKEDLLQMEIKEVDARVQEYFMYIEHARRGWIEEHIIDYLKREEHPPPSIRKYCQFDAVKDYKYLKKLKWMLNALQTGGINVDMEKLHSLVNEANQILQNDTDGIYRPYRGNPVIPNNLKGELAKQFKMGATTVYEYFDKYIQRDDQGKYKIKPTYLFFS